MEAKADHTRRRLTTEATDASWVPNSSLSLRRVRGVRRMKNRFERRNGLGDLHSRRQTARG